MKILFLPKNVSWEGKPGLDLMTIAAEVGVIMDGSCGGRGTCKKCRVVIEGRSVLACQYIPEQDCIVEIASDETLTSRKVAMSVLPASFEASNCYTEHPSEEQGDYGLAFDIGTTTVVGALYDLRTSETLGIEARTNPQGVYGADVISRIQFVMDSPGEKGLATLHRIIIACIDDIASHLAGSAHIDPKHLRECVLCGNTTMSHLVADKNPATLAVRPFSPAFRGPLKTTGEHWGFTTQPDIKCYLMPNIAGHVGSDITADLTALRNRIGTSRSLMIDVGTNGEIFATNGERSIVCSTAAGPAFEGATIKKGMRAAEGAIERVFVNDEGFLEIATIGNTDPVGICGSGIIDVVAVLLESGIVEASGRIVNEAKLDALDVSEDLKQRVRRNPDDGRVEFVLYWGDNDTSIAITQQDVREVQLGKGATSSGMTLLMREINLEYEDLDHIFVAGAFGNHIDLTSAQRIGLIPPCDPGKVEFVGNTAIVGTSMCLLSSPLRKAAEAFVQEIDHIELAEDDTFQKVYLDALSFKQ